MAKPGGSEADFGEAASSDAGLALSPCREIEWSEAPQPRPSAAMLLQPKHGMSMPSSPSGRDWALFCVLLLLTALICALH